METLIYFLIYLISYFRYKSCNFSENYNEMWQKLQT